jgi:hypothetical protein
MDDKANPVTELPVCSDNINEIYESEVVQWFTLLKGVNH